MPHPRLALPASSIVALLATALLTLFAAPAGAFQGPWALPADTLSAEGQSAVDPQVAVAPDGTTTVVWYRSNGTNNIVQASTRPPGSTFGSPVDLSATGQSADSQQVAVGPDGTTTVVWSRFNGTHYIVQASTRPPGGSFGGPVDLSAPGRDAYYPQLAVGPDGATTVVWERSNGTNDIAQASTRPPGGSFGSPVDLSATGQSVDLAQVAVGADGATTAAWTRSNGANDIVQASTRPPGGSFSPPADLSATGQNASGPELAVAPDGTVTVVWTRSNGANSIVQASTRASGESFAPALDLSAAGQNAGGHAVAVAADGTTTAVWSRSDGANTIVQARTRPPGGSFAGAVDLSAAGQSATIPQVAVAKDGTTSAIWRRFDGTNFVVQVATRPPGGNFAGPIDLSAALQDANDPQLAVAPDGSVAAAWMRLDGTNFRAQASSTANPPALLGAPRIFGTPTLGSTLSCDGGLWTGAASVATSWLRDGAVIASGPTYAVAAVDQGRALLCRGLATNGFGAAEAQSLPVVVAATPAAAPDRTAPTLTVLTKARLTRAQFRNGVSVRISANERTTVLAELLARAKGAKISAVPYNLVLGSRTGRNVQNSVTLRIKPNRTLVGKARSFSIRLRLTAEDAAGNRRVTGKTIKVAG